MPIETSFVCTIAPHRNSEKSIEDKLTGKNKNYINSTLVITSPDEKTRAQLPKINIFANGLWRGEPSLVFDDKIQFFRFFPRDIASDHFEFDAEAKSLETRRLETHSSNLTIGESLPKSPKTTITETVEKLQELWERKQKPESKNVTSDYLYDNGTQIKMTKRVFLDPVSDTKTMSHNENHIYARFHNVKSIAVTKQDSDFTALYRKDALPYEKINLSTTLLKSLSLIDFINKNKKEILEDEKKLQQIIEFEKEKVSLINEKIEHTKKIIKELKENAFAIEQGLIKEEEQYHPLLLKAFERKKSKHSSYNFAVDGKSFATSTDENGQKNAALWLKTNIEKEERSLVALTRERNFLAKRSDEEIGAEIVKKLQKPTNLVIYDHLTTELTPIATETLRKHKERAINFIQNSALTDSAIISGLVYRNVPCKYTQELIFENPKFTPQNKEELAKNTYASAIEKFNMDYLKLFIEHGAKIEKDYATAVIKEFYKGTTYDLLDQIIKEKDLESLKLVAGNTNPICIPYLYTIKAINSTLPLKEVIDFFKESQNEKLIKTANELEKIYEFVNFLKDNKKTNLVIQDILPSKDNHEQIFKKFLLRILKKEGFNVYSETELPDDSPFNELASLPPQPINEDFARSKLELTLPKSNQEIGGAISAIKDNLQRQQDQSPRASVSHPQSVSLDKRENSVEVDC